METIITEKSLKAVHIFIGTAKKNPKHGEVYENIPLIDDINEPKLDKHGLPELDKQGNVILTPRTIRYIPGEKSIYADEQPYKTNKDAIEAARGTQIMMKNGVMYVEGSEINKLLYLRKSNRNGDNPYRRTDAPIIFFEHNPERKAEEENEKKEKRIDSLHRAKTMDITELKAILLVLKNDIGYAEQLNKYSISELRHEAYRLAEMKPEVFLNGLETTEMKNKFHVMNAVNLGYINFDKTTNRLTWKNGDEICRGSLDQSAIDTFIRMASQDARYGDVMDEIKKQSFGSLKSEKEKEKAPEKPTDWLEAWVESAAKEGKIKISENGAWFTYVNKEGQELKFKGKKSFKEELLKDDMLLFKEISLN